MYCKKLRALILTGHVTWAKKDMAAMIKLCFIILNKNLWFVAKTCFDIQRKRWTSEEGETYEMNYHIWYTDSQAFTQQVNFKMAQLF